jgi:hypothetical protein
MTIALTTRGELDQLKCEDPCCEEMNPGVVLFPSCHPESLTIPLYIDGELRMECGECGGIWMSVPVAG